MSEKNQMLCENCISKKVCKYKDSVQKMMDNTKEMIIKTLRDENAYNVITNIRMVYDCQYCIKEAEFGTPSGYNQYGLANSPTTVSSESSSVHSYAK